jgi:acetyl esterase/lipase
MIDVVVWVAVGFGAAWGVARLWLWGADLSAFDSPDGERFARAGAPGAELQAVLASLGAISGRLRGVPMRRRTAELRRIIDEVFAGRAFDARFVAADAGGVPAEWVLVPGADPKRRLLYIHGGAFIIGSPRSHRTLTTRFAQACGGAVLALDYRLMPEHSRRAGIADCRTAYRWLLDHGPDGEAPAQAVFVAGDSAGGNLALSLINWVRDEGLRLPDAAVAMSPLTDATLGSPSLKANVRSDPMLGPLFGPMARLPRWVLVWIGWLQTRIRPNDPVVSPALADLSRLPPVLVQASEHEMLRDDARRWVNKARAAGSPARLQTWDHMVHVWQIFNPELPEAEQALGEIGRFLQQAAPLPTPSAAPAQPAPPAAAATMPAAESGGRE